MVIEISPELRHKIANAGFVCMCFVVSLHVVTDFPEGSFSWWLVRVVRWIGSLAVPLFFVISGFLMAGHIGETGWWGREVRKRVRSLLVPFVIWNVLTLLLLATLTTAASAFGSHYGSFGLSTLTPYRWLTALGLMPPWRCELPYLWFLQCLFALAVVAPLLAVVRSHRIGLLVLLALFAAFVCQSFVFPMTGGRYVPFFRTAWGKGFCFFPLGIFLRWNGVWAADHVRRVPVWCWLTAGLAFGAVEMAFGGVTGLWLAGVSFLMVGVWRLVPTAEWPKALTRATFPILLLQYFAIIMLTAIARGLGLKRAVETSVLAYFVQIVLVIALCVGAAAALRRAIPRVSSVLFGGRS